MAPKSIIFGGLEDLIPLIPVSLSRLRMIPSTWAITNAASIETHNDLIFECIEDSDPSEQYLEWAEIAVRNMRSGKLPNVDPEIFSDFTIIGIAAGEFENEMGIPSDMTYTLTHAVMTRISFSDNSAQEWMQGLSMEMGYQMAKRRIAFTDLAAAVGLG